MHTTVRVHHLHRYIGYLNSLNRSTLSIKETRNTVLWLTMLYQKMDRQADLWLSSTSLCQFPFLCYLHVSLLLNNTVPQYKYYNSKQVLGYTTLIFNTVITSRGGGGIDYARIRFIRLLRLGSKNMPSNLYCTRAIWIFRNPERTAKQLNASWPVWGTSVVSDKEVNVVLVLLD
jgi:hypothetical protein